MAATKPFWKTAPGLSAIAALVTAVATAGAVLVQVLDRDPAGPTPAPATVQPSMQGQASGSQASPTTGTRTVFHPSGAISVDVPADWAAGPSSVYDIRPDHEGEVTGLALVASNDPARLQDWRVPGAVVGASRSLWQEFSSDGPDAVLADAEAYLRSADWGRQSCIFDAEQSWQRDDLTGLIRRWTNCGQVGARFWEVVAIPAGGEYVAHIQIQFVEPAGVEMAQRVLDTFLIRPDLLPALPSPDPSTTSAR
jgi:hypothetical protein